MAGGWNLQLTFYLTENLISRCTYTNEVLYIEKSWTYLQVLD
jgi:hypothetical protein